MPLSLYYNFLHFQFHRYKKTMVHSPKIFNEDILQGANHFKESSSKKECEDFVNSHRNDFDAVPWGRIKTFIFNEGRKNDSDQL